MSRISRACFGLSAALAVPGWASAQAVGTQVASGGSHSCARIDDGTLRCWGSNQFGQLGDGTNNDRKTPVSVSGIANAVSVEVGEFYSCAVLADGTARCWGQNNEGQLGDGSSTRRHQPVAVSGLDHVSALAAGSEHTCALIDNGSVKCWGGNGDGQLGDSSTVDKLAPVPVTGVSGALAIAVGESHSCALISDGSVRCWGWNGYGQLGNATVAFRSPLAVPVTGISTARAIGAGLDHTCANLNDGSLVCWGYNGSGGIGDGTTTHRTTPMPVTGISNAQSVSAGFDHSCARLADHTLRCWGSDQAGELGDGVDEVDQLTPVTVALLPGQPIGDVASGNAHGCALTSTGVHCWGANDDGQLGNGSSSSSLTPILVSGLATVVQTPALGAFGLASLVALLFAFVFAARRRTA